MNNDVNEEKVLGIDKRLLVSFLELIKDKYPLADKAHFFLQTRAELPNIHGVANLRDVLSHLTSLLDESEPPETKRAHLDNAAEHFRRAILEPYESAINRLANEFDNLYKRYRRFVLPVRGDYELLRDAPDEKTIEERVVEIKDLALRGREAKRLNVWNDKWEEGVTCFLNSYDDLRFLYSEIEHHLNNYRKLHKQKELLFYKNQSRRLKNYLIGSVGLIVVLVIVLVILFVRNIS